MSAAARLWILSGERLDALSLGPMVRYLEMAKVAALAGFSVKLCLDGCSIDLPPGVEYRRLSPSAIRDIEPGERVVVRLTIPPAVLKRLLESRLAFDVDFYSIPAAEGMESDNALPRFRLFRGRRRTALRYQALVEHARRILISIPEHEMFLGGILFSKGDARSCRIASELPSRCIAAPMGVSSAPFPDAVPNPYPSQLRGRPVFLWGGGIWAWFDVESLLQAFALLQAEGSNAALFFLCGTNPSGLTSQDGPVRRARERAAELGLVGTSVFFLDGGAKTHELPGYLAHCTAGIMSNPVRLEALCSWRTRFLDLLWANKPLVVCGYDPLSDAMARDGRCVVAPSADPRALADAVRDLKPEAFTTGPLADSLHWPNVFADWIATLDGRFPDRDTRPGFVFWLRYLVGA